MPQVNFCPPHLNICMYVYIQHTCICTIYTYTMHTAHTPTNTSHMLITHAHAYTHTKLRQNPLVELLEYSDYVFSRYLANKRQQC